jgi:hypothetical protein
MIPEMTPLVVCAIPGVAIPNATANTSAVIEARRNIVALLQK